MLKVTGVLAVSVILALPTLPALAFEKMGGCLVASKNCEAFRSIRKRTNPGHIRLEPGISYPLKGKNKQEATHYQVRIEALKVPDRWVGTSCGKVVECSRKQDAAAGSKAYRKRGRWGRKPARHGTGRKVKGNGEYLLAISWEPAFCEGHRGKAECKAMTASSFDANNLSLHGLWPQPRNNAYCNVSGTQKALDRRRKWNLIDPLKLTAGTMAQLRKVMPGVMSNLQRHEWIKHGSCYKDGSAETYYRDSIALINQVNASAVRKLLAGNIGRHLSAQQIRNAFDEAFGKGSGSKVNVRCDRKKRFIAELWINLKGEINQGTTLAELLKNARLARNSCQGGLVDAAGYN